MKVNITDFSVAMEVKNNGIQLDIHDPKNGRLGDCIITKTKIIWCNGQTAKKNGKVIKWTDFIEYMNKLP